MNIKKYKKSGSPTSYQLLRHQNKYDNVTKTQYLDGEKTVYDKFFGAIFFFALS